MLNSVVHWTGLSNQSINVQVDSWVFEGRCEDLSRYRPRNSRKFGSNLDAAL